MLVRTLIVIGVMSLLAVACILAPALVLTKMFDLSFGAGFSIAMVGVIVNWLIGFPLLDRLNKWADKEALNDD